MKIYIFIISCILSSSASIAQNEWIVPPDQRNKLSSVKFTKNMSSSGETIYNNNCIACHGTPTKKNFNALLQPSPGDPAANKFQSNTDGELFYKIREGRAVMPSFKNALSVDETWSIISYIRGFNKNYTQEIAQKVKTNIPDGTTLSLKINKAKKGDPIIATLSGEKDGEIMPIEGVAIKLSVKRSFGNLTLGEEKLTNKNGEAAFSWNNSIPGDSIGNVSIIAQIEDSETYGKIKDEQTLNIAKPTNYPPLNEERAIWNTFKKAPYWILISYFGAVLTVWFFILFVVNHLRKIWKQGNNPLNEEDKLL